MDGDNQIYINISPLWNVEDDQFDINEISEDEIKQFLNLEEVMISLQNKDKLIYAFEELGIKADII